MDNGLTARAIDGTFRHSVETANLDQLREFIRRSWRSSPDNPDPTKGWTHESTWRFADGTEAKVNGKFVDDLVLPAQPGFEAIFVGFGENEFMTKQAVIGWRMIADDHNEMEFAPIVLNEPNDPRIYVGVIHPDGRILWHNNWFTDETAFVEAARLDHLDRSAKEAERRAATTCPTCGGHHCPGKDDDIPF